MIIEGDFYRKTLVLAIIGLFLVTSMIPVSSLSIDKESCESTAQPIEDLSFNSTFPYLRDDIDTNKGLSKIEDFEREVYEKYPWHYDQHLRNHSDYPFDEDMEKQGFWEPKLSLDIKVPDTNTNSIPVKVTLKNHRFLPIPVGEMDLMQLCDYGRTLDFEIVTPDQHTIYFMGGHWRKDDYRVWLIPFGKKYYLCDLTKKCFGEKEEECYSFLDNPGTYTIKAIYNSDGLAFASNLILPHMVNTWDGHLESETKTFELEKSFIPTFDGNTLYVGGTGPGNYSKIQDAINNSSNRDTIFVFNGTYYENLFIDKTINLIGEDKYTTIIDGGVKERCDVVHIRPQGDGVLLSGFTIQYSGQITGQLCYDVGVEIHSDYNTISDNIITNNHDGIFIYASNNNNIINNVIRDSNYSGIAFFSGSNNTISFNNLSNNRNGIEVRNTGMSNENTFSDNVISNNFFGIKLWHSRNIINRNNFINNSRQAVTRFNIPRFSPSRNSWDANYWDDWIGIGPKHIPGFFGFNFDWHPVSEPYEIIIGRDDDILYSSSFGDGDTKYWAVISAVGINPHQIIQCSRDLKAIYNVMINHGWNDENIKVLLEEEATKEAIIDSFQWLNESGEDEDDVIFFFSNSHGYYMDDQPPLDEPDGKDGFIMPFDCDWETWDNCILDDELAVEFDKLKSKNIFIVIDSCHAGEFIDGSSDLCKSGRVVLTGCDVEELGGPLLARMRWLFPYYFTKGLNGPADKNNDNLVSAEETFSYAKLPVMIRSTLFNLIRSRTLETQHPQIFDGWPSEENNGEELNLIDLKKGFISEEI